MKDMISMLQDELNDLKISRRKLVRDLDEIDTKIIGIRLKLENLQAEERYQFNQNRYKAR